MGFKCCFNGKKPCFSLTFLHLHITSITLATISSFSFSVFVRDRLFIVKDLYVLESLLVSFFTQSLQLEMMSPPFNILTMMLVITSLKYQMRSLWHMSLNLSLFERVILFFLLTSSTRTHNNNKHVQCYPIAGSGGEGWGVKHM